MGSQGFLEGTHLLLICFAKLFPHLFANDYTRISQPLPEYRTFAGLERMIRSGILAMTINNIIFKKALDMISLVRLV